MSTRLKVGLLLLILAVITTTTMTVIYSQQKQNTTSLKKTINDEDVPIANFNESLPTDLREKEKRQKRSKRGNLKLGAETGVFDPKRFMLTEARESTYGGFPTDTQPEPAIPAAQSDAIIIGEATKSEAFLTEDKVSIYSEFTVSVSDTLKNSTSKNINAGDSITISRGGGGVRFPSGKIIKTLFEGKPMPHVGSKYVFFLKYNPDGDDYPLITAYELRDNKIIPLDGLNRNGNTIYQLASHQNYKGMSETEFLNLIQQAVSNSEDLFEKKEVL